MQWPKGKYGDSFGGWGNTFEEAQANRQKAEQEQGGGTSGMTDADMADFHERLKSLPKPRKRRPRPEGAPLTKTELKRKATKERVRARLKASNAKYGNKLEEEIAAAAKKAGQPLC